MRYLLTPSIRSVHCDVMTIEVSIVRAGPTPNVCLVIRWREQTTLMDTPVLLPRHHTSRTRKLPQLHWFTCWTSLRELQTVGRGTGRWDNGVSFSGHLPENHPRPDTGLVGPELQVKKNQSYTHPSDAPNHLLSAALRCISQVRAVRVDISDGAMCVALRITHQTSTASINTLPALQLPRAPFLSASTYDSVDT